MKKQLKQLCGNLAVCAFPKIARSIEAGESEPRGSMGKLISESLIRKAALGGDESVLREQLSLYWKGDSGDAFYDTYADRFDNSFLGEHYSVVEALEVEIKSDGEGFAQLYEIGCGDGQVLSHLSGKFANIDQFVGIDINENIIAKNLEAYQSDKLNFVSADAIEHIKESAATGTVMVSYGGVMEYFLESELAEMFQVLKEKSPVVVALVEPLYGGFDPDNETASRSTGVEHSFSHNHRYLLEEAGFEIKYQQLLDAEFRWMMIVARG